MIRHPRGPEEMKAAARELGCSSVTALLALARRNDPYLCGGPADRRDAEWFAGLWQRFGYTTGVHLRRVHYQVFSTRGSLPGGERYENTDACWDRLCAAGKAARYLGLVDPEAFTDARNEPPRLHVRPRDFDPLPGVALEEDEDGESWAGWYVPSFSAGLYRRLSMPRVLVGGYGYDPADQPVLVEVWIEKSTMDDVLVPVCRALGANLLSGAGFQSITAVISLLRRAEAHGKPAHVLYVADFDPAGTAMPVAVARQAQFWRETLGVDARLTLEVLALTRAQVEEHQLPRAPVKVGKDGVADRRGKRFEQIHGEGIVELDALEALHPGALSALVRRAAQPYRDDRIAADLAEADSQAQQQADEQWQAATADLAAEMRAIDSEIAEILERHRPALAELRRELAARRARLNRLVEAVEERFAETPFALPVRPEAAGPEVSTSAMLYDSRRHWTDQLAAFKAAKGGAPEPLGGAA